MSGENAASLGEQRMTVYLGMMVLGFPLAFFVPGYLSDILSPHGYELFSVSHAAAILFVRDWAILLVLGWVQWFVIFAMLLRLLLRRRRDGRNPTAGGAK
jgi:predicted membrane protein